MVALGNVPDHAVHFHRYRGPVGIWACPESSSPCPLSQRSGLQTKVPASATARWGAWWDVLRVPLHVVVCHIPDLFFNLRAVENLPKHSGQWCVCGFLQLDTGLLSDCLPEVTRMARKFTHISTLLQYLHLSLTCMCEAWEDILMQMDLRLTKFVQVGKCWYVSRFGWNESTRMSNFVPRKRTQTPKFRMSFLSFYCGDNRGE